MGAEYMHEMKRTGCIKSLASIIRLKLSGTQLWIFSWRISHQAHLKTKSPACQQLIKYI
ncbi:conserved hypothetical protein [Ricinus communis]|uniref:Uncharacterized protein n=1 Tax=Ricinus communis TaxID=3988 RepID=B9TBJ8_RICCO|nr:conserved hypothetical protein [Ricinus communis]